MSVEVEPGGGAARRRPPLAPGMLLGAATSVTFVASGLMGTQALSRLRTDGPNELERKPPTPAWRVLLRQFKGAMLWLLIAACIVAGLVGEVVDAAAIAAIVVLNGLVGFFQESRAERAVQALRSMTAPRAKV